MMSSDQWGSSFDLENFGECTQHPFHRKCPPSCEAKWRLITDTQEGLRDFVVWFHEVVLERSEE